MLRILAIAPNEGLSLSIREVSQRRSHIQTTVRIGDLAEALEVVQSIPERGSYRPAPVPRRNSACLLARKLSEAQSVEMHFQRL